MASVVELMKTLHVADALEEIMNLARRSNKYIDVTAPWVLAKNEEDRERLGTVLYHLLESLRYLGVLLRPFLPETGDQILAILGVPEEQQTLESLEHFGALEPGRVTGEAKALFARLDEKKLMEEIRAEQEAKEAAAAKAAKQEPEKTVPEIGIEDFEKVQLKVGEVLECRPVEGAKKLLVSKIRIGSEVRQIVSGIAQYYKPEEMVGKKVVVVTNLKPVKLRGELSEGMILCASDESGRLALVSPEKAMDAGAEVR